MTTRELAENENRRYGLQADFAIEPALPSFEIRAKSGRLLIAGASDIDLLHGVYAAAELYGGYTFFEPGRDIFRPEAIVHHRPDGVLFPARAALLKTRGFIQEFPFNDETPALFDWMAKNNLNYLATWMKYYDDLSPELKEFAKVRGIEIESGHHNFNYWIPGRLYAKTHPEFMAMRDGKRITPQGESELLLSEQLCTTNPLVRAEFVRRMLEYCDEHPEIHTISLTPNDGFGWCECPECSKFYDTDEKGDLYSVSNHVYKANRVYHALVRDVATRLHAVRPDIRLTFCAYVNYCRPAPGMTLDKGLAVHLAYYWRCINHAIDDPDCPVNSHYLDDTLAWRDVKQGGEIFLYEYYMGVNFYLSLPMIHHRELFREIRWYAEHGVDGLNTQFHLPHWTVYGTNYYLMAKAMRGDDCESAIAEMYRRVYGEAAEAARQFHDALKALVLSAGACHIPHPYSLFSRTTTEQYESIRRQADKLADAFPDDRHIQEFRIWGEYLCRFKTLFDHMRAQTATEDEIQTLLDWIHTHADTRLFVQDRFDMYFEEMKRAVRERLPWIHFNIPWEDNVILQEEKEYFGRPARSH